MKPWRFSVGACLGALLVLSGCSASPEEPPQGRASPSSSPSAGSDPGPLSVPAEDPPPCALVRAGIDAFNLGSPATTVRLFERAVPVAKRDADAHPSRNSRLMLAAVEYFAALPAQDYAQALTSSPEFKRHQVVTLTLCRYGAGPSSSPSQSGQST